MTDSQQTQIPELTPAEETFVKRMAHHVALGKSFDEAAKAVIDDDARIYDAFCDQGHSYYISTPDEFGASHRTGRRPGDGIADEITRQVYSRLRQEGGKP